MNLIWVQQITFGCANTIFGDTKNNISKTNAANEASNSDPEFEEGDAHSPLVQKGHVESAEKAVVGRGGHVEEGQRGQSLPSGRDPVEAELADPMVLARRVRVEQEVALAGRHVPLS